MNKRLNKTQDVWIYRISVATLGLVVLASIVGAIVLSAQDKIIPDTVVALGAAAAGSLAGLLAPSPLSKS